MKLRHMGTTRGMTQVIGGIALASLLWMACNDGDNGTGTTPSLIVGRALVPLHTAPGDTTMRTVRLSLGSSDAATLDAVADLQAVIAYDTPSDGSWTLAVTPDTLADGALALVNTIEDPPRTEGVYRADVSITGQDYDAAAYAVEVNVHPFLIRLVLPPLQGYEEDVDAVTQASDVIPELSFVVLPPTDGTDSLKDIRIRTTDIDTTIYRSLDGSFWPALYGRKFPVTHWYVKDTSTAGICTTYAYAETYGGQQSMDMVVVRVLNKDEH